MKLNTKDPWPFPTLYNPTSKPGNLHQLGVPVAAYTETLSKAKETLSKAKETFSKALDEISPPHYDDLGIVHIYDPHYPKGGMTVAYRKSSPFKSGVMVEVAVQVCSETDSFSKKIGKAGAKERFLNGETIHLPILRYFGEAVLSHAVKRAFTALNDEI